MGRKRIYGDEITISLTPGDKRQLRTWARKDKGTVSALLAALIRLERQRRAGDVQVIHHGQL